MEVMNIYSQRIPRSLPRPSLPPTPPPPSIAHQSSQTTLSCPPFKSVSMQHRSQLKATASQTEVTSLPQRTESSTQTEARESKPAPSQVAASTSVSEAPRDKSTVGTRTGPVENEGRFEQKAAIEAERSKQELLQRLRVLDSQKTAPASNSLSPSPARTSVPPTTQPVNPKPHPVVAPQPPPAAEVAAQEQERKRLLLAKLMAIDEGGDPNHVRPAPQQNPRSSSHRISANKGSSSSLTSWPEVVENMHHGRPAHASEDDPFGSRSRLTGWRRSGGRRGENGVRERVVEGAEQQKTFLTEAAERRQPQEEKTEYKPSFGRRATRPTRVDSTPNHKPHPPPGELITSENYIPEASPSISRGGLLPRRPKADTAAMTSHDVMPGAVLSEPDDIEELVL